MSAAVIVSVVLFGLVLLLALVLPAVTSPTVPFGVRVPAERTAEPAITGQVVRYRWRVLIGGFVVAGAGVALFIATGQPVLLPLAELVLVAVWYACFFVAHHEVRAAKVAGNWFEGQHEGIAVDTELRTDPLRFPWLWLAPAVVITAATVVIGVAMYPSMPQVLAVHFDAKGVPDRLVAKSVGAAFSLVFVQLGLTVLFAGIAAAIVRSRPDIDPARPVGYVRWYRGYALLGAKALLGLVAMVDLAMLGSSLLIWTGTVAPWAALVVAVPVLGAVIVTIVVLVRNSRDKDDTDEGTGLTHRDDDKYWRGGVIYINRTDTALLVPRRFGLGWTLNAGNPRALILLAGILAVIGLIVTLRFAG